MESDEWRDLLRKRFVLFSVEGTAEGEVIDSLIRHNALVVPHDRLVSDHNDPERLYTRTRKAKDIAARYFNANYCTDGAEGLTIVRITDTPTAKFDLPRGVRDLAAVLSFYMKPEIEMLAIHREGAYQEWLNASRKNRSLYPCEFCKRTLGLKDIKETRFLRAYWDDIDELVGAIEKYARNACRRADELMLIDLLAD